MAWDGTERRKSAMTTDGQPNYCPAHITFVGDLAVIKTSLSNIEKGLVEDRGFKHGVITALIGVFVVIIIQICGFAYALGQSFERNEANNRRIEKLEQIHPRADNSRNVTK